MRQGTRRTAVVRGSVSSAAWGALALVAAAACAGEPGAPPPAEAFFNPVALGDAKLSPDGSELAFTVLGSDGRMRLGVLDLEANRPPRVAAAFRDDDVDRFEWVDAHRLVFNLEPIQKGPGTLESGAGLFAADDDASHVRQLVETTREFFKAPDDGRAMLPWNTWLFASGASAFNGWAWVIKPEEISLKKLDYIDLQRVNTRNGAVEDVDAPLHAFDWVLDAHGVLQAAVTETDQIGHVMVRDGKGGWKSIADFQPMLNDDVTPLYASADGKLYVASAKGRNTVAVLIYDLKTGTWGDHPFLATDAYDLQPTFIEAGGKLLGVRYVVDALVTQWFDPQMQAIQKTVDDLLGGTINVISVPSGGISRTLLVESFSDRQPRVWRLYDTERHTFKLIGQAHPAIDARQMGATDFVHFTSRDGLSIPAYLTLPPGGVRKHLPMVVMVHGGPWVRGAAWGWDPQVQFLASRGYAVLQPEFRGSTGFGKALFKAGWKQWGLGMQNDVADATKWAIAQGVADPKRICIVGASYGGYAVLMGLANNPELFRCGVEWAGVTDPRLMYTVDWSDISDSVKRFGLPVLLGDPQQDAAQLKATAPVENAARITQPLLMAYGGWDLRVPLVHGETMRDALKATNPHVEWVVYPEEGHGWHKAEDNVDFWTRVERFLAQSIPPQ